MMNAKRLSAFESDHRILLWPVGLLIVAAVLVAALAAGAWPSDTVRSAPLAHRGAQ